MNRLPLVAFLACFLCTGAIAAPDSEAKTPLSDGLSEEQADGVEDVTSAESDEVDEESEAKSNRKRGLFPPRKRTDAQLVKVVEDDAPTKTVTKSAPAAGADVAPLADGIWAWVDRMEGEIPSSQQVEALEELAESERSEQNIMGGLVGAEVPTKFYKDPVAALKVDPLHLDEVDLSEFDIPIEVNAEVAMWVKYFNGPGLKYYARWLGRSTRFRPMMYRELDKAGLPRDMVYLSMIESGYNAHAYSHAAAAGLWQFIPSTARLYKVRVDWWVDDRRDPEQSLHAAINLLSELHKMFGDWPRAWAAYNTGPGRVRRASTKAGSTNYWDLVRGPYLHSETDNYVPKIMAAAIIGHHPERYGFTDIVYQDELKYDVAHVSGSVELKILAKCAGTDVDTLKLLNPALRRFATPPEGYDLRVPVGKTESFKVAFAKVPKSDWVTVSRHTVKKGETLSVIASRYGVSTGTISSANSLANANRIYVGMSLVIPRNGQATPPSTSTKTVAKSSTRSKSVTPSTYTVRKGDTLSTVAARYGTSTTSIKSRNGLSSSTIYVGQKLKLSGSGTSAVKATTQYTIKRGDSLSRIADAHGVRMSDLQKWNNISNASNIQVGQKLKIVGGSSSGSSSSWKTYAVRSGDSLGAIATRNNCSVSELQSWNSINGSVIQPGQKLKIKVK
ncbi:MAG: LysM peptidoglycan-binding domain-containing protein [Rhodobacterales bacterium]|nr:LysM peptidoglycan-binding domain-containing protein [Rhodobacterales bacterium]